MDKQVILDAIVELEQQEPTIETVQELATLYIVAEHLSSGHSGDFPTDKKKVLASYNNYCDVKRSYQLHQGTSDSVLGALQLVCYEIEELIAKLYSGSDMRQERKQIRNLVANLYNTFSD